ncbi:MAG TPA: hypothetical protein VLD37_05865 [Candidatus Bilamarchaeum sp.]|nr:hypothetical protein [Candidatus Bilamarchaeum sp.]
MGLKDVRLAAGKVFSHRGYVALAAAFSLLSLLVYVSIPVFTIPGNSYGFFLASTSLPDLAVIAALSALMGIVLSMQAYCWKNRIKAVSNAGVGIAGFLSGAVSAIFASATCTSCVSALFSFLGFGGVLFLLEHKAEVTALTGGLVLVSLYFTSRRIAGNCESCKIAEGKK